MTRPPVAFELGRLPRITFGAGSLADVPDIVAGHGSTVALITGGSSFRSTPGYAALRTGLAEAGVMIAGDISVRGEPSPADLSAALDGLRGRGVDVIVAVGGGSVLDMGKAVAGLLESGTQLMDHIEGVGAGLPYPGPALPVVAVPTTAGTGSEATRNAVFTERGADGYKRSFRDERLVPADAVVDPDMLVGAPRALIAANGLDALTQLIEAFTSQRAGPLTDGIALAGLAAARDGLVPWYRDPDGDGASDARSRMAYAALSSGICLANAGLGAVHGLASPLGALLPIPHGMACGAVLWQTIAANIAALEARDPASDRLDRYAELGRLLDGASTVEDEAARAALVSTLRAWTTELSVPSLRTFGMVEADIATVVADSAGSSMRTNPIELTEAELTAILAGAL